MQSIYDWAQEPLSGSEQLKYWRQFESLLAALADLDLEFSPQDLATYRQTATPLQKKLIHKALKARDLLVASNQGMVIKLAEHFANELVSLEELIQQGNLGLMRGLVMFQPKKKAKVSSYCYLWAKARIYEALYRANPIYVPPKVRANLDRNFGFVNIEESDRVAEFSNEENQSCSLVNEVLATLSEEEQKVVTIGYGLDEKDAHQGSLALALELGTSYEEAEATKLRVVKRVQENFAA